MAEQLQKPTQLPSETTVEENLLSASQRKLNLIWEYTQATIALSVVGANIIYVFTLLFTGELTSSSLSASALLSNAFFLVIGFYFGRTNHARIGDVATGKIDDRP